MSPSRSEFGPGTNTIVFKRNHSYLMLGGARGRMSWCLWHRLDRRRYLDADDVRFSKSDELAIAQRYWNDDVAETVTFGELYQSRITSTLSACMEHVFPRWYDGRIMMIGDAAHKVRSAALGPMQNALSLGSAGSNVRTRSQRGHRDGGCVGGRASPSEVCQRTHHQSWLLENLCRRAGQAHGQGKVAS